MGEIFSIGAHVFLFITLYFEVFLFMTFLESAPKTSRVKARISLKHHPFVSIAVPCYNEEKSLPQTMASLIALEYPRNRFEILMVDDGSTDKTWEVMQKYKDLPGVRLFQKENGGKHTALNLAIKESRGEIFGCLDADSSVAPNALSHIVETFENPEVMAVTPAMGILPPQTFVQKIQKAEYSLSVFFRKCMGELNGIFVTPGPFSFFRREVFLKIGTYRSAHNTEDLEMALRLQKNHLKIVNNPDVHVFTNTPRTMRALHRQRLRWVYGFIKNAVDYRALFFNRRYGNLGILILPGAAVSIFSALFIASSIFYRIGNYISKKYVEVETVGFQTPSFSFSLPDWFFISTGSYIFLAMMVLTITVVLMLLGKGLMRERPYFPSDIVWYLSLYGFLAPFWLSRALFRAMRSAPTNWVAERNG
jgi:cellulose synthase/poly-beta-1,6-N-acetylglucosamine synthase-like glycosyltransferase